MAQHLGITITDAWIKRQELLAANRKIRNELVAERDKRSAPIHEEYNKYVELKSMWAKGSAHLDFHAKQLEQLNNAVIPDEPFAHEFHQLARDLWEIRDMDRRYFAFKYEGAESI
jgi:hypothetical protein